MRIDLKPTAMAVECEFIAPVHMNVRQRTKTEDHDTSDTSSKSIG